MKLCLAVSLLVSLVACDREAAESDSRPELSPKRKLEAGAINLCDRWSDAAKRGDVTAALACFEHGHEFSYSLDGQVIDDFDAFRAITHRSYEGRKSLQIRRVSREVTVLGDRAVLVTGSDHYVITTQSGQESEGQYAYGIVCRMGGDDAWRIVHAYETRRR